MTPLIFLTMAAKKIKDTALGKWFNQKWRDFTGQTAIDMQNKANLDLAKYQTQIQENFYNKYSSPEALMRQYKEAGLNPNLVYSSLASGQSNVPSFNAPTVERSLSGSQKFDKMLSTVSGIMGLVQGVYNTAAARESANQSAIKSLNDLELLKKNKLANDLEINIQGYSPSLGYSPLFGRRRGSVSASLGDFRDLLPTYSEYFDAMRSQRLNAAARSTLSNLYDFGASFDLLGNKLYSDGSLGTPYFQTRNQSTRLKYDLMKDLGNKGVYGKLAVSLLNTIF